MGTEGTKQLSCQRASVCLCLRTWVRFYRAACNADAVLRWEFCPSVRLSVRQTRGLWQNGRKMCLDFYTIRKIIYPSFRRKRMVCGGGPFYLKFRVNRPRWSEIANFEQIITLSGSAVTSSEKVQLTLIGSPLRAFQWAQEEHRTLSLSPKAWLKNTKWTISCDNSATVRDRLSVTINH